MAQHTEQSQTQADEQLKHEIEQIIKDGKDIRERVRKAVEASVNKTKAAPERLTNFAHSTVEAAVRTVDESTPKEPESVLRQVVDGLGDALQRTAQATRLAVQEAAGEGKAYASEDLKQVASDFKTLSEMFVDTVGSAAKGAARGAKSEAGTVRDHAARTFQAIKPSLQSAAETALKHPLGLAGESATAAVNVTRHTAGALFSSVGNLLKTAGDKLSPAKGEPKE
jgi:hypothetical protein